MSGYAPSAPYAQSAHGYAPPASAHTPPGSVAPSRQVAWGDPAMAARARYDGGGLLKRIMS